VAEAVEHRRADALWDREGEHLNEPVEYLARAPRVDAAPTVEAEQRIVIASATALELASEELTDARPMGDEAALAEFAPADNEELTLGVDIADAQAARFPCSQPETVAEGEDGVVRRSAIGGSRAAGKSASGLEQSTGLGDVEEERYAPVCLSSAGPDKR
jgi:hypothetical protein